MWKAPANVNISNVFCSDACVVNVEDKDNATLGEPASLGALFDPANQVVLRPHSALAAMGRWLDATGKLPRPWMDGYTDMAAMAELWDIALAEAIKAKGNVVQWWSGENEANAGFTVNGATLAAADYNLAATLALDAAATATISGETLTITGAVTNAGTTDNALNFTASTGKITLSSLAGAGKTRFGSDADVLGGISVGTAACLQCTVEGERRRAVIHDGA